MHAVLSYTLTLAFPETMAVMSEPLLFFEDAFKLFEIIGMRAHLPQTHGQAFDTFGQAVDIIPRTEE